eukprot:Selendium_serpulae@DN1536_c0_g1_i1.p1
MGSDGPSGSDNDVVDDYEDVERNEIVNVRHLPITTNNGGPPLSDDRRRMGDKLFVPGYAWHQLRSADGPPDDVVRDTPSFEEMGLVEGGSGLSEKVASTARGASAASSDEAAVVAALAMSLFLGMANIAVASVVVVGHLCVK